jgi:polyisoprenyl-phosphate glycosyltransferase
MYIKKTISSDAIVVMDADGEDTPDGLRELLDAYLGKDRVTAVFAERTRRLESLAFQSFYLFYKVLHWALTGVTVRVGNFSVLPPRYLDALSVMPELWNHYAAAVFRSRLPLITIPIPRGRRIAGKSKMNFVALVSHGLSAIAVFADIVGARLLTASLAGVLLAGTGIAAVIVIRVFTNWAIPGWATYVTALLTIILIQFITIAASFTFTVLSSRTNFSFLPVRDYAPFIAEIVDVYPHE